MFLLPVHVAEVHNLVEHPSGSARNLCFGYGAIVKRFGHLLGVELHCQSRSRHRAAARLFRNVSAKHVCVGIVALRNCCGRGAAE